MHIHSLIVRLAAAAGLAFAGLVQANTVAAVADPLPNQTLTITTQAATTSTETRTHPRGTLVRLNATASPGYQFLGWSNACSGTNTQCAVQMVADRTVVARFGPQLVVSVTGGGSVTGTGINCGTDCREAYPQDSSVTLTATPATGQVFSGWGGACSGTASTCTVAMAAARTVSAGFAPAASTFKLSVNLSGSGTVASSPAGVNCGSDCWEYYAAGTSVTLSATPAAGQQFSGWSGACTGTGACTVSMSQARNVGASFTALPPTQFTLGVSVSGAGAVSSSPAGISCGTDCAEAYAAGTSVTLTATPAAGQQFSGWSGACAGTGACTVSMGQARSVGAAFAPVAASGPVYYFADCQQGALPGCVAGDNANAGTSPLAPRRTLAGINIDALPAGTQLLFARGGAWTDVGMIISNPNVTAERPLVFASYASAWGGEARPWFKVGSLTQIFVFGWYNETQNDGGYTIRGLKLDGLRNAGGTTSSAGIFVGNNVHHVLLEDLDISGFHIAVQAQENGAHPTTYTLRNSYIHHNAGMGLLGDGTDVVIENNLFEANNYSGSAFNHAIYLGGHGRNGIVRNNRFVRNSVVNGRCTGGNVTVHGQWDGLLIENNSIEQDASDMGCYGFSINGGYDTAEWFRRVVVRGNRVINLGGCAVCLTSAPGVVVENNLIVNDHATYNLGIVIPDRTPGPGDDADGGAIIRNNTIVLQRAVAWNEAIALRANSGTGHTVVSNLIYFGTGSDPQHSCFSHAARSSFAAFDNNLCHHAAGSGNWSQTYPTLGAANAAGFDVRGLAVNPLFTEMPSLANDWLDLIQTGSPARAAGHPALSSTADRLGVTRPVPASIGARETTSGSVRTGRYGPQAAAARTAAAGAR